MLWKSAEEREMLWKSAEEHEQARSRTEGNSGRRGVAERASRQGSKSAEALPVGQGMRCGELSEFEGFSVVLKMVVVELIYICLKWRN